MDIAILLKTAGAGLLVSVSCILLSKSGRDEQAMLVSLAGIVIVLLMLMGEVGELIGQIKTIFGI